MSQHSLRFPACQSCRHQGSGAILPDRCTDCREAAAHEPRPALPTRGGIDTTVLSTIARYSPGTVVTLDDVVPSMAPIHKIQVCLDLEDKFEPHQMHLPPRLIWDTPRQLADAIARQLLTGARIDHAVCTDGIPKPDVLREPWPPLNEGVLPEESQS